MLNKDSSTKRNMTVKKTKSSILQDIKECCGEEVKFKWSLFGDTKLNKKVVRDIVAEASENNVGDANGVVLINKNKLGVMGSKAVKKAKLVILMKEVERDDNAASIIAEIKECGDFSVQMFKVYACGIVCTFITRKEVQ